MVALLQANTRPDRSSRALLDADSSMSLAFAH